MDRTCLRDRLRADDAHVLVEQVLEVDGVLKRQDVLAVCDRDGVGANGDDAFKWDELDAAIPVVILDRDGGDGAVLGVDEQGLAHAELAALGDADHGQS